MKPDKDGIEKEQQVLASGKDRVEGVISKWETDRGFGWVKYDGGSLFAHIREFDKGFIPRDGDKVTFMVGLDPKGRPSAKALKCPRHSSVPSIKAWLWLALLLALPFAANLKLPTAPWMVPLAMLPVSVAAWILYRYDKKRANAGRWRVSETELHGLELFGGWPGAFLAQQKFRHKTRKLSYQAIFWSIVFLYQLVALDVVMDHWLWTEATTFMKDWMTPNI
ncbi:DUF1294 domain-containing protein [Luteolibacter sp. AS25]|uniref:DUF1294 domain-containing protein n=1 Tax=Luteolibacter sp. AS25 TaxID=3135776 RepID=UPI00398A80D0